MKKLLLILPMVLVFGLCKAESSPSVEKKLLSENLILLIIGDEIDAIPDCHCALFDAECTECSVSFTFQWCIGSGCPWHAGTPGQAADDYCFQACGGGY